MAALIGRGSSAPVFCVVALLEDMTLSLIDMTEKFQNSGYKRGEINSAYDKAMQLNRDDILATVSTTQAAAPDDQKQLMFVANRDDFMTRQIKDILKENQRDIDTLLGDQHA